MTILEFCNRHDACAKDRNWALSKGVATMAELWERTDMYPAWRVWIATRPGVLPDRDLRLYICWCVRQVWHLLADDRSRNAVEVAGRYAVGEATANELAAARLAAWAAYADARAVLDAAYVAATSHATAARAAARAAYVAAADAACDAAESACDATYAASRAAVDVRAAQAAYLVAQGNPFKEVTK
jgi:hypothetical protein